MPIYLFFTKALWQESLVFFGFILITLLHHQTGLRSIKYIWSQWAPLNAPRCWRLAEKRSSRKTIPFPECKSQSSLQPVCLPVVCDSVALCSSIRVSSFAFPVIRLIAAAHSPSGWKTAEGRWGCDPVGRRLRCQQRRSVRHIQLPEGESRLAGHGGDRPSPELVPCRSPCEPRHA